MKRKLYTVTYRIQNSNVSCMLTRQFGRVGSRWQSGGRGAVTHQTNCHTKFQVAVPGLPYRVYGRPNSLSPMKGCSHPSVGANRGKRRKSESMNCGPRHFRYRLDNNLRAGFETREGTRIRGSYTGRAGDCYHIRLVVTCPMRPGLLLSFHKFSQKFTAGKRQYPTTMMQNLNPYNDSSTPWSGFLQGSDRQSVSAANASVNLFIATAPREMKFSDASIGKCVFFYEQSRADTWHDI